MGKCSCLVQHLFLVWFIVIPLSVASSKKRRPIRKRVFLTSETNDTNVEALSSFADHESSRTVPQVDGQQQQHVLKDLMVPRVANISIAGAETFQRDNKIITRNELEGGQPDLLMPRQDESSDNNTIVLPIDGLDANRTTTSGTLTTPSDDIEGIMARHGVGGRKSRPSRDGKEEEDDGNNGAELSNAKAFLAGILEKKGIIVGASGKGSKGYRGKGSGGAKGSSKGGTWAKGKGKKGDVSKSLKGKTTTMGPSSTHPPSEAPTALSTANLPTGVPSVFIAAPTIPSVTPAPTPTGSPVAGYEITQELLMPTRDGAVFEAAAARWESVIIGDLSNVPSSIITVAPSFGCTYPSTIDDLFICSVLKTMDGSGNLIGTGRVTFVRPSDGLPIAGDMEFDVDDIDFIRDLGLLEALVLHEMGHVLGIGTLWDDLGVAGPTTANCPYTGPQATAEYQAISGCTTLPTEQTGGSGTRCKHWDETCLGNELMTGQLSTSVNPLSRITIGSLEDMGYVVDYSSADPFGATDLGPGCTCRRRDLMDTKHKQDVSLGAANYDDIFHDIMDDGRVRSLQGLSSSSSSSSSSLSEDLRQYAIQAGLKILDEAAGLGNHSSSQEEQDPNDAIYVGDQMVFILMLEGDKVYSVMVTRGDRAGEIDTENVFAHQSTGHRRLRPM